MGAPESNAGDDFHFWWAASRALALIEPGTESRLLVVEGLAPVDDPDDEYEIADVAEYLGGADFASATTVLISQLKYSTRHPDRPWTAARITRKRSRRGRDASAKTIRSVIRDLSDTYARLVADHGRDPVTRKVRISLVSNQPGDPLLKRSLTTAAAWARAQGPSAERDAMLNALPVQQSQVIRQLSEAVGQRLTSADFCDFLTVLDLSQTGALDRAALARSVRAGAAELSPGRGPDSSRRLFDLVRRQALPESRREGLTAADVLAELDVADLLDLYPAPPRLVELPDPLPAPGARAVAETATAHLGGIVVAHGPAGAGKTTAVRQAVDHLPEGSTVLLYDCYGGGEYLSAGEERHTPPRFVMQVANDLAQRCGTPLLLHPPALDADLWRNLSRRLTSAVDTLPPGAVLVLAVDAADNAAVAAAERGDSSFLPGLLALPLPPRVTVVLTARSHRIDITGAADAPRVGVVQFDAATSAVHLRQHRPQATDTDTTAFHERTGGNPRVQFYVLEQATSNDWTMPALLEACTRTPEPLFADLVDSALQGSGAGASGQRWLALMLALARPVSIGTLADALDVDAAAVSAFADGLTPGVQVLEGAIQFRDEDFETYVRGRVDRAAVVTAHGRLADLFLARRAEDADAAAHVAEHLFAAARYDELLQLVLGEDSPRGIADGFRREQVQGRRLDLAVRAAAHVDDAAVAVRIAARACDTASRIDTLSRLVESHLDLVARYVDIDLLRNYALRQSRGTWLGPIQMRLAAVLSRDPQRRIAAREALESADAWVNRWMAGPEDETRHWRLDAEDVAAAAEAYFRLDGVDVSIASLRRWRPVSFALEAAAALAARVAGEVGPDVVGSALAAASIPALAQAPFLAYAAAPTASPDSGWIEAVVAALVTSTSDKPEPWHARLLDAAVRHGSKDAAGALVRRWKRDLPASVWAFRTPGSDGVGTLRCHAAAAALGGTGLDVNALVPASLQPSETKNGHAHDPHGRERGEWIRTVGPLGAIALLAARAAAGDDVRDLVGADVDRALAERLKQAGHRWFKYDTSFRTWASLAAEAVVDADAPAELLDRIADAAPKLVRDGAPELWLDLAEVLAARPRQTDRGADLCMRAAAAVRAGAYPAPERLELLTRAADIAGRIAPTLGRQLFDHAVDAATGINDDAARLLAVYADLAHRATLLPDERTQIAARLVRAAEDVAPHVTDPDIVPYGAVASVAAYLDATVGFAAVSRWDDEARVRMASTLPPALLGAVDGGAVSVADALALDHLVEDDGVRLGYQLTLIEQLPEGDAGTVAARRATARASLWLRYHVPARFQPAFAQRFLDESADRALDAGVRAELEATRELTPPKSPNKPAAWSRPWAHGDPAAPVQALLDAPRTRSWPTLAEDVALLVDAYVYGERLRSFVTAVLQSTPPIQRLEALAAVMEIPGWRSADTVLPVLADFVGRWREWPGVREWAVRALPSLLVQHLPDLVAWPVDVRPLVAQLRDLVNDDDVIRRAVLGALPESRPQLSAQGWHNIAALLSQLCPPADAASALVGLLADRTTGASAEQAPTVEVAAGPGPIAMLLWSAFGHPRREIRWRAAHAVRDMLTVADQVRAADLAARLISCLDLVDVGQYRDRELHFYRMSALAGLLTALARVAADRPALLVPHVQALIRIATSRDLPHGQIRELARSAALAVTEHLGAVPDELRHVNRPAACAVDREYRYGNDRHISKGRRYRFDQMDTIPYWYAPLARVFGVETDAIAERAERWILDEWSRSEDDWMTDGRELRDERSYRQMQNNHGSIPPEENLRLYLEYHAMLVTAGELIDAGTPVHFAPWDDAPDPWLDWLQQHLPFDSKTWLSHLRAPVPVEPELFGCLPPLAEWDVADLSDYDRALGLVDGCLSETVTVAGDIRISRPDSYGSTYISSALVAPDHATDLQRALAAASNPRDYKLPDEDDDCFEIDHGPFTLRGWLTGSLDKPGSLDEHDPYAHGLYKTITLPGRRFRDAAGVEPDRSGLILFTSDGTPLARAEQWSDPATDDSEAVTSSGYRVHVDRTAFLRHLRDTDTNLIVEVQIGRHRNTRGSDEYRPPRSRIYLIDATGRVTVR